MKEHAEQSPTPWKDHKWESFIRNCDGVIIGHFDRHKDMLLAVRAVNSHTDLGVKIAEAKPKFNWRVFPWKVSDATYGFLQGIAVGSLITYGLVAGL